MGGIGLERGIRDRFGVPAAMAAILSEDDGLDFLGRKLAVFIGHADVGAAV